MKASLPPGGDDAQPSFHLQGGDLYREGNLPEKPPDFREPVASLEQVYLALVAAGFGIWEWRAADNTVTWSQRVDEIFGQSPDRDARSAGELFGQIPAEDAANAKALLLQKLREGATGKPAEFQCRVRTPAGKLRWIEIIGSVVDPASPRLLGTIRDVTERHQLAKEARFYRALLECQNEASLDGILVVASDLRILYSNARFAEIWGVAAPILASGDGQAVLSWVSQFIAVAKVKELHSEAKPARHNELQLRDGRVIERYCAPIVWNDGSCQGHVWYFRDLTEKRRLEQRLQHTQRLESLGAVASGIAHELRNILTPIILHTQLIQEDLAPADPARSGLDEVMKCCDRANQLVQQILTFSRRQESCREPVDLSGIVADAIKLLKATIPASVTVLTRLAEGLPIVLADATQIHQVVMNLGINAWHAFEKETGLIEIVLEDLAIAGDVVEFTPDLASGHYVRLSVRDNGKGMDEATLSRIFEPFFTTKPDGKGTGLGLSVVHGIVKSHYGTITVESKPGQGAVFQIYFPTMTESSSRLTSQSP